MTSTTGKRPSNADIELMFHSLRNKLAPPSHVQFRVIPPVDGYAKSPPSYEYEDGLYVLLKPQKKRKPNTNNGNWHSTTSSSIPPHLASYVAKQLPPLAKKTTWSLSGPQFKKPTRLQQRYCYPKGTSSYCNSKGAAIYTIYEDDGVEDLSYRLLHVYSSKKRSDNLSSKTKSIKNIKSEPPTNNNKIIRRTIIKKEETPSTTKKTPRQKTPSSSSFRVKNNLKKMQCTSSTCGPTVRTSRDKTLSSNLRIRRNLSNIHCCTTTNNDRTSRDSVGTYNTSNSVIGPSHKVNLHLATTNDLIVELKERIRNGNEEDIKEFSSSLPLQQDDGDNNEQQKMISRRHTLDTSEFTPIRLRADQTSLSSLRGVEITETPTVPVLLTNSQQHKMFLDMLDDVNKCFRSSPISNYSGTPQNVSFGTISSSESGIANTTTCSISSNDQSVAAAATFAHTQANGSDDFITKILMARPTPQSSRPFKKRNITPKIGIGGLETAGGSISSSNSRFSFSTAESREEVPCIGDDYHQMALTCQIQSPALQISDVASNDEISNGCNHQFASSEEMIGNLAVSPSEFDRSCTKAFSDTPRAEKCKQDKNTSSQCRISVGWGVHRPGASKDKATCVYPQDSSCSSVKTSFMTESRDDSTTIRDNNEAQYHSQPNGSGVPKAAIGTTKAVPAESHNGGGRTPTIKAIKDKERKCSPSELWC